MTAIGVIHGTAEISRRDIKRLSFTAPSASRACHETVCRPVRSVLPDRAIAALRRGGYTRVNYLGRNRVSCAVGLRDYHRAVRRLRTCATGSSETWVAQVQLERLQFDVQVDVLARSGPRSMERMTEVEAVVFYPTLVRLNETLTGLVDGADPVAWRQSLATALGGLRQAVRGLQRQPCTSGPPRGDRSS